MTTIDQKALSEVEIVLPDLELQRKFRSYLEKSLQHEARLNAQKMATNRLFHSLQHRAFSGHL